MTGDKIQVGVSPLLFLTLLKPAGTEIQVIEATFLFWFHLPDCHFNLILPALNNNTVLQYCQP
jgi:hypothetical protein